MSALTSAPRFFNTAGPVDCRDHYCLPPLDCIDRDDVLGLIAQKKYFVLHAPRQTGKTTCLLALRDYLNADNAYRCLYVNVEAAQAAREDVEAGMNAILSELSSRARDTLGDPSVEVIWQDEQTKRAPLTLLNATLTRWADASPKPIVLLVDEIDALIGDTLIAVLRQLRAGYDKRPHHFPHTIILCGVRDVRDYRIHSERDKAIITGGSAFNIKAESLRLGDFNQHETDILFQQHTLTTGQAFEPEALHQVWYLTRGQPWLVNALGYETCFKMKAGRDRSQPITAEMIAQAKENLILRRETHLDQLVDKLKEDRVRRVIEPMLKGEDLSDTVSQENLQYIIDLGLVRRTPAGPQIANPVYREIISHEGRRMKDEG